MAILEYNLFDVVVDILQNNKWVSITVEIFNHKLLFQV